MSNKPDFRRLAQIFFRDVSDKYKTDLMYFVNQSSDFYSRHFYARANPGELKEFQYPGIDKRTHLSILMARRYDAGRVIGVNITGRTTDFSGLISLMRGKLTAQFSDLAIDSLDSRMLKEVRKTREDNIAHLGNLCLYLSPNPANPNHIYKATLEKKDEETKSYEILNLEDAISTIPLNLLEAAVFLSLYDSYYKDNDPHKDLFHESCQIEQRAKGRYAFSLNLRSAIDDPLPEKYITRLQRIFHLTQNTFSQLSAKRMRVEDKTPSFQRDIND